MVKQRELIKVNLNSKQNHEQQGYKSYICVSHELVNTTSNIDVFAPISNTAKEYPFYVESVSDDFLIGLPEKVKLVFENN